MNTVDMTKGSPFKLLLQFCIPILLGNLFQQVYSLADRIIVGRFVGDIAFSAIGATNAMSQAFMAMCTGAAIGTGVVVSQYFGAKNEKGTASAIANGFGESVIGAFTATTQIELLIQQFFSALGSAMVTYTGQNIGAGKQERVSQGLVAAMKLSGIVSMVLLVLFWLFGRPIMGIFVINQEIISIAASGIRITSLFLIALGGVQILRYMLNGAGDSVYALMNGAVEVVARVVFAISLTAIPFIGMWEFG